MTSWGARSPSTAIATLVAGGGRDLLPTIVRLCPAHVIHQRLDLAVHTTNGGENGAGVPWGRTDDRLLHEAIALRRALESALRPPTLLARHADEQLRVCPSDGGLSPKRRGERGRRRALC